MAKLHFSGVSGSAIAAAARQACAVAGFGPQLLRSLQVAGVGPSAIANAIAFIGGVRMSGRSTVAQLP
jgi:hypothetical protein